MDCNGKHVFLLEELYSVAVGYSKNVVPHCPLLQINPLCVFTELIHIDFSFYKSLYHCSTLTSLHVKAQYINICLLPKATHRLSLLSNDIQA